MKKTLIITCFLLTALYSFAAENTPSKQPHSVRVISRRMDTFFFKVPKEMIGAEIEVYTENGEKVKSGVVTRKHGLVDFFYENAGVYKIVFRKGNNVEDFKYIKTTTAPDNIAGAVHFNIA